MHHSQKVICINGSLKRELRLIRLSLANEWVGMAQPIGCVVPRDPSGTGYADSCLRAAGGFIIDMKFWWYHEWSSEIQANTPKYVMNEKDGTLVAINALEYASLIIN